MASVGTVEADDAKVNTICTNQNFTNVTSLQAWIAPVWYGDYTAIMAQTGLNQSQITTFYSITNNSASFGAWLNDSLAYNYKEYDCPSAQDIYPNSAMYLNCSGDYLANKQWGGSYLTLNPPYNNEEYFPTGKTLQGTNETLSICEWGVEGINCTAPNGNDRQNAPEYFFYAQYILRTSGGQLVAPALDSWQVGNLSNDKYSYYGIGNSYNSKQLFFYYSTNQYKN
jgi:hypothetical protein